VTRRTPPGTGATVVTVDLSTGRSATSALSGADWRRDAGSGLVATRIMLNETPPGIDPFAPDALLVIAGSAVSGHDGVGLARCAVAAKSPATGGVGEARIEGTFPVAFASAGIDVLVLRGRAPEPSIVVITPDEFRVVATGLWGTGTAETTDALVEQYGPAVSVAVIGPAGERLVRFASIVTDRTHPASRMGLGAVAGSKLLKGIVVVPGPAPVAADPPRVARITTAYRDRIAGNPQTAEQHDAPGAGAWPVGGGLPGYVTARNARTAWLPVITVRDGAGRRRPANAEDAARRVRGIAACPGCPLDCVKTFANAIDHRAAGLDEESLAAFAYGLGITDLDTLLGLVASARDWGVDPVSLAGVVAFAVECAERGAALPGREGEEAGPSRYGDQAAVLRTLRAAALREPGGDWLSDGVARASAHVAPRFRDAALHVKGLETVTWDPRASAGQALATAVGPLGPRYEMVEHDIDFDPFDGPAHGVGQLERLGPWSWAPMDALDDERVARTAFLMDLWSGLDAIGICLLAGPPVRELDLDGCADLVGAVTGWNVTPEEILAWGRRRLGLMRAYNAREGIGPDADRLPDRYHDEPIDAGRFAGNVVDRDAFRRAVDRYRALTATDLTSAPHAPATAKEAPQ
jgi:aldehyde:ferredoxin oxidoreductase